MYLLCNIMSSKEIILPNEILLSKVAYTLSKGGKAIIPVKGSSMHPFIRGGEDSVELFPPLDVKEGDIVLAEVSNSKYLLHRIYSLKGDNITLMGDGNVCNKEYCSRENVIGKALYVIDKKGRKKDLYSWKQVFLSKAWKLMLPYRGLLLRIYRKLWTVST